MGFGVRIRGRVRGRVGVRARLWSLMLIDPEGFPSLHNQRLADGTHMFSSLVRVRVRDRVGVRVRGVGV